MSQIFEERTYYKPMVYPWAFDYYLKQQQMHWLPEEAPLHEDVKCWNNTLSSEEKNLLTQLFRFFTQGDVDVAAAYYSKYIPLFKHPELRMMMGAFASTEGVHIHAYSALLDTVGMPEVEYKAFTKYKEMADKHDYVVSHEIDASSEKAKVQSTAEALAVYSAFTEGLQLFSSFVILLNFQRYGKMTGMCKIVEWSIRDESLHVEGMIQLFRAMIEENPKVWTDAFKKRIYEICRKMVELEDAFIDLVFEQGGVEGLTPDEVKQYVRYIADRRLLQLGLKPNFKVKDNPLPWVDWIVSGVGHTNFFENRETEYSKGAITGWDDAF